MSDYTELKRMAEHMNDLCGNHDGVLMHVTTAAVLALIAENERLSGECEGCPMVVADELRKERDQLKAEVDSLTREADRQYMTIEAYRHDAERYRWLRDPDHCEEDFADGPADNIVVGSCGGEDILWRDELDAAIDAAMASGDQP